MKKLLNKIKFFLKCLWIPLYSLWLFFIGEWKRALELEDELEKEKSMKDRFL